MKKEKIKYLTLSDIHLGHSINKTEYIINNLKDYFRKNSKEFKTLDLICLVGDIFDKLLINSSKDFIYAVEWLTELILFCKDNRILLRILEGTPSHDWKQAKVITSIIQKLNIEIDYKYIDTLYIEENHVLGLNILYIPDEYRHKASDTFKEVKKLFLEHKLTQVDIAFIHGQFHYQLPMVQLESSHNMEDYLNLVKYYISVGHIHTPSVYERIIAQGSFDRLAHNEEEDKGGVLITLDKKKGIEFKFIKNENAMLFKTYRFETENLEEITKILDKDFKNNKKMVNVRIISNQEAFLNKNLKELKERYVGVNIKIEKPKDKNKEKTFSILESKKQIETFHITRDNIQNLMKMELVKYHLSEIEKKHYDMELKTILDKVN